MQYAIHSAPFTIIYLVLALLVLFAWAVADTKPVRWIMIWLWGDWYAEAFPNPTALEIPSRPEYKRPDYLPKRRRNSVRANQAYYSSAWWKKQKRWFWEQPENQICRGIQKSGARCSQPRTKYFQVDHIVPLLPGVTMQEFLDCSQPENLQPLCPACHARKTLKENRDNK